MKAFFTKAIYVSFFCALLVSVLSVQSCNISKHIPKDSYLLSKVKIKGEPSAYSDEIYALVKPKPNKRIFGVFRFNMWSYLWANKSKVRNRRAAKLYKLESDLKDLKNEMRTIPAEDSAKREQLQFKISNLENRVDKQRERVNNLTSGTFEAPVLLDSALSSTSAGQIQAYIFNKGYFNNTVDFEIVKGKHKATVIYTIKIGDEFRIKEIDTLIYDPKLIPLVLSDSSKSEFKVGQRYDGDAMARERERLFILLRNHGYYNFSREYIYYEIDSALDGNFVNVGIAIANPPGRKHHRLYKINNIYIEPEYTLGDTTRKESVYYKDLIFKTNDLTVKPQVLADFIFFRKNHLFKLSDYKNTLNKLAQLNLYRFVDVQFSLDTIDRHDTGLLNIYIRLTPMKRQGYDINLEFNTTEEPPTNFTSSGRSLGLAGSFMYRHKNIARSGLQLEIRPRGAVELPINQRESRNIIDTLSFEYGISNSLIFPQPLIPRRLRKEYLRLSVQTALNLNYIFEQNRYFKRTTLNTNLTYVYTKSIHRIFITPLEISLVNTGFIRKQFENDVRNTGDPLLINLFDRHIIGDVRIAYIRGEQPVANVAKKYWFFRNSIEFGGNIMPLVDRLIEGKDNSKITSQLFGINYYRYIRNEIDVRFYLPVLRENNLALRGIVGTGLPYGNSTILPFERRFYVGGSNSIRAWRLRELGPGGYTKDTSRIAFDQSGDIKIETNAEFRFPVYSIFKSAFFIDAGNVWTYKDDTTRNGDQFHTDSFLRQFAVGAGIGLRFDFSFFVFRLDVAIPVRDPSMPHGQTFVLPANVSSLDKFGKAVNLNLGIGYPF